jgi:putative glutamine amidotransferase
MTTKKNKRRKSRKGAPDGAAAKPVQRPHVLVLEGLSGAATVVRHAGGTVTTVSPRDVSAVEKALRQPFDALLLTGGGDVDPRRYGEKPHARTYGVNETRDRTEWAALDRAAELGVPVLGICRGSQLMAVHNGGRLKQHIQGHRNTQHLVWAQPGTHFKRVVGNAMRCVSLHHQIVLRHGNGFRVAARNREGMIEAIESRDGRCLGVQFHPEIDFWSNEGSQRIIRWLVEAGAAFAGVTAPPMRKVRPNHAPKATGKHRAAGTRTAPKRRAPVRVSWLCPTCGIRFDKEEDRNDHIWYLHEQQPLFDKVGKPPKFNEAGIEPPEDHPDWEPAA